MHSEISKLFSVNSEKEVIEKLNKMGEILSVAKPARNHENYDSLVIFHHHNHNYVTEQIKKLQTSIERSSYYFLINSIDVFSNYVLEDAEYLMFLNRYDEGWRYLMNYLSNLNLGILYEKMILPYLKDKNLFDEVVTSNTDGARVKENIQYFSFYEKLNLLSKFASNVTKFHTKLIEFQI